MTLFKSKGSANFKLFLKRIYHLQRTQKKTVIIIIVGPMQHGKSTTGYRIMMNLDFDFNPDRIVYSTEQFLEQYNKEPPEFSWFMFDDAGVGIPAKRWYEDQAVFFGQTLQFGGNRHYGIIITVPDLSFIEPTSRALANYVIIMDEDATGFGYVRRVKSDRNLTHPKKHYPYLRVKFGKASQTHKIKYIYCRPLPEKEYSKYDDQKREKQRAVFQGYEKRLKHKDNPQTGRKTNPKSLENIKKYNEARKRQKEKTNSIEA